MKALKVFFATLFPDEDDNTAIPQDQAANIYRKLCDACLLELRDADKAGAKAATKVLAQAITASGEVYVARAGVPDLADSGFFFRYTGAQPGSEGV